MLKNCDDDDDDDDSNRTLYGSDAFFITIILHLFN